MLTSPESNIKLTDTQSAQVEETRKVLLNLESEISIASKNLKAMKSETERVIKENSYQDELLKEIISKTESAQKTLDDLLSKVEITKTELNKVTDESNTISEDNIVKSKELEERENKLALSEQEYQKKEADFNKLSQELSERQISITIAKDAFLKATETVIW